MPSIVLLKPIVKKLVVILITCALLMTPIVVTNYSSAYAASDSVTLSVAEADSLIDLIDNQELDIRLLRIDLWEARRIAHTDSVLNADRLRLYQESRPTWFERFFKKPELWFMVGVVAGLYARSDISQ
jgi:hypothetical protein